MKWSSHKPQSICYNVTKHNLPNHLGIVSESSPRRRKEGYSPTFIDYSFDILSALYFVPRLFQASMKSSTRIRDDRSYLSTDRGVRDKQLRGVYFPR